MTENCTDKAASKYLGKKVSVSDVYNPSLLVAVPRFENRQIYGISNDNLPFDGFDVWHAFEFSSMTQNGLPVTRLMKIKYPCQSEYIVESKSLKLYLNSFNMHRLGETSQDCLILAKTLIEKDLSEKLGTKVEVSFFENSKKRVEIFEDFQDIMTLVDETSFNISAYREAPEVLNIVSTEKKNDYRLMFDSLRSNCRVTHQPDFGDVFIYYCSKKHIEESSLVEYLVSFRSEYHFHEECCEMIYKRLYDLLDVGDELFVCALYTRRGGIDICPSRWSKNCKVEMVKDLLALDKIARYGNKG